MTTTVHRVCTLCEAHCGIRVDVEGGRVKRITGDPDDVMSHRYICPKAAALADLQADPDRLRTPVRKVDGRFVPIGWDEAIDVAARGLRRVREQHGADAIATYLGNPGAHSSAVIAAALFHAASRPNARRSIRATGGPPRQSPRRSATGCRAD
jgi:anaerobic selenocysteine-containing dehydrogenase